MFLFDQAKTGILWLETKENIDLPSVDYIYFVYFFCIPEL